MKKHLLFLTALLATFTLFAQLSTGEMPPSFSLKNADNAPINTITLQQPDVDKLLAEDESEEAMFKPRRFGVILRCDKDFFENATIIETKTDRIYRLAVEVPEAQALVFYSERFRLPKNGKLFLYNDDRSRVLGAFSSFNNHELYTFATEYLEGERIIFEYVEPLDQSEKAELEISEIGYAYRDIPEKSSSEYRSSGSCNVNVNCSEGDDFRKQQRAVARILVKMDAYTMGWCTGTLINNTNYDRTPYLLTAAHCIESVSSSSYYSQFVFYFNYETSGCSTPSQEPSRSHSLTGATVKAYDNTYSDGGSDFCLLLLNDQIPQSYNPFWCGWDNRNQAVTQGVCIHHPSGDVKKISTFNTRLQSISMGASTATHWLVKWEPTTNGYGITEGGSSGSALFNVYGQIIGDLTGGTSACNVAEDDKVDYYGKLSYSWSSNGSSNSRRLKPWLDTANTGVSSIGGMDYNSSLPSVAAKEDLASIAPNPAKDILTVTFDNSYSQIALTICDQAARVVRTETIPSNTTSYTLDLQNLKSGVYFITIKADDNISTHKVVIY